MAWKRRKARILARRALIQQERERAQQHEELSSLLRHLITLGAETREETAVVSDELIDAIIARVNAGGSLSRNEIVSLLKQPAESPNLVHHARFVAHDGEVLALDLRVVEADHAEHPELWEHHRYVIEQGVLKLETTSAKGRTTRDAKVNHGVTARA